MRVRTFDHIRRLAGLEPGDGGAYVCRGCGASFAVQYHVCPTCGGYSVERRRDEGSGAP